MEKKNLKNGLRYIPEVLLLIGGIFCLSGELASNIPISLISGLILFGVLAVFTLLIWKNKYYALTISIILSCISIFFLLALLSEFSEFPSGSKDGAQMLLFGGLLFGGLFAISVIMPIKYFKMRG
jgi:hypothetical protein